MESVEILPGVRVTNDRCLLLDDGPTVVLGDLHLGYEKALEEEGMIINTPDPEPFIKATESVFSANERAYGDLYGRTLDWLDQHRQ